MRRVLIASAAAHLLVFACLMHSKTRPAPTFASEAAVAVELSVDSEPAAPGEVAAAATSVAMVEHAAPARHIESLPAPTHEIEPDPSTPPYAGNGTIVVFAPNIGLGSVKSGNPFLRPGALPPPVEAVTPKGASSVDAFYIPDNKRAEQSVKDALRERDSSLGLGPEGSVVHALEDAAHGTFAPTYGAATFMATVDERGIVIDLKVLSMSDRGASARSGWDDVRAQAAKKLASAKIDLRGAKGAQLEIEVTSSVLTAAGSNPNKKIVPTFKPSLTETNAPGMPETRPENGHGVLNAEIATFDVTDAKGKPTRVVHAKLVMLVTR